VVIARNQVTAPSTDSDAKQGACNYSAEELLALPILHSDSIKDLSMLPGFKTRNSLRVMAEAVRWANVVQGQYYKSGYHHYTLAKDELTDHGRRI